MKILQIIDSLTTGGAEKLILETIPLLSQKGIQVDLLVLDGNEYPYMKQLKALNCCTIFSLGKGSLFNPFYILKIIPYLKKYDLLHVHLFPAQYWVILAKIISFSKVKLVFTEHNTSNTRMQKSFFRIIDRNVYKFYDKVVCISKEVKQVLLEYVDFKSNDLILIENGVNLNSINEALAIDKKKMNHTIHETDKLLIQVAGFRIQKDQKTVIRAMQYLQSNVKLLLVGDGALRSECELLVSKLNLQERVFFLGVRTDVPSLLKTADVSVVSSHWEGFGLVAVEGMATGKPVIASDVPGLSNVVEGAGILFERGNEKDLALKIQELLDNVFYYTEVAKAGLDRANEYDINIMVDKQIKLYRELLNKYY